jgi:hypothetical protein
MYPMMAGDAVRPDCITGSLLKSAKPYGNHGRQRIVLRVDTTNRMLAPPKTT